MTALLCVWRPTNHVTDVSKSRLTLVLYTWTQVQARIFNMGSHSNSVVKLYTHKTKRSSAILFSKHSVMLASAVMSQYMHNCYILVHNHPPYFEPQYIRPPSNFVTKRTMLRVETFCIFSENRVILASAVLSQYTRVIDDRRHIMTIAKRAATTFG